MPSSAAFTLKAVASGGNLSHWEKQRRSCNPEQDSAWFLGLNPSSPLRGGLPA